MACAPQGTFQKWLSAVMERIQTVSSHIANAGNMQVLGLQLVVVAGLQAQVCLPTDG